MHEFIGIHQENIYRSGLHKVTNLGDWATIDYIMNQLVDARKYEEIEISIFGGRLYVFISYDQFIKSNPMIGDSTKQSASRRFRKLEELGLIHRETINNNRLFVTLTDKCLKIFESPVSGYSENEIER